MDTPHPLDVAAVRTAIEAGGPVGDLAVVSESANRWQLRAVVGDGERRWIVRRPRSAEALQALIREDDILGRLRGRLPVAEVAAAVEPQRGDPFDVITYLDGLRLGERLPASLPRTSMTRHDVSEAVVEALVRIHAVDLNSIGLPAGDAPSLEAGLDGWQRRLQAAGAAVPAAAEELLRRLRSCVPPSEPALMHGSFHMHRVILDPGNPRHACGVIGWSRAGVGDPQLDLGLLMAAWVEDRDEAITSWLPQTTLTCDDGFFSRATVAHEYANLTGRDVRQLEWFVAAGYLRLIVAAAEMGTPDSLAAMDAMAAEALARASHSGISGLAG